ncbi:lipoprotein N-acyltransferase Lnb domain-containing protein [Aureimonas psammosilenae]|uniref:lipoprotein N-acyltransferase Lnb domain-containing protein n=1 Tax=Aureimonas psammosilenae TaxID=2495496 RepID=UPI0012608D3D|nr:DUF4105 domain-containing protein [Aureimonas psammosilenae]
MQIVRHLVLIVLNTAIAILALLALGWSSLALWFHIEGAQYLRATGVAAWMACLICLVVFIRIRRSWIPWTVLALLAFGFVGWWFTLQPRLDRDWAPDVSRIVTGRVEGDKVTLDNVRDFEWRTQSDAIERWRTETYDLTELTETDLVLSYWGMDAIAHTLISFGFADGRRVVFSVEIRREKGEEFSSLAGFFKSYELSLIAAEERDIIFLRTNMRGEDTYLYPLALPKQTRIALFLNYVQAGNLLAREPAFYNTLTANCTTVIFDLAKLIEPGIPMDWRILLSGYLPSYLAERGALAWHMPDGSLRRRGAISEKAKQRPIGVPYSEAIRRSSQAEPSTRGVQSSSEPTADAQSPLDRSNTTSRDDR